MSRSDIVLIMIWAALIWFGAAVLLQAFDVDSLGFFMGYYGLIFAAVFIIGLISALGAAIETFRGRWDARHPARKRG